MSETKFKNLSITKKYKYFTVVSDDSVEYDDSFLEKIDTCIVSKKYW
jgi:hypothetical protein